MQTGLYDAQSGHIVIETSGLALPKPLVQAFNWPEIASRVTVDGVVAVVDGAAVAAGRFADDPEALARQRAEDQSLDHVDWASLRQRLSQNSTQEKLTKLWIDRCLKQLGLREEVAAK